MPLKETPKVFLVRPTSLKNGFSVELALRANVVRPGAHEVDYAMPYGSNVVRPGVHEVDYAMPFLAGNARLWLLSCLERGHNFTDWVSLKSALAETFGPVEAEEEFSLALFSLCQTDWMSLEEYVSVFRIWMDALAPYSLHEDYRLPDYLNSEVMLEHPWTLIVRRHSSGSRRPHELTVVQH